MSNSKGKFNAALYAVVVFVLIAAFLATTTVITFKNKYLAFSPETLAVNYTDAIAQKGDGYNAYKYTFASKSDKYGDFIRKQYMYPVIYPNYKPGDEITEEMKKAGLNTDEHKSDATLNDDGSLAGKLASRMYPYYVELMKTCSWDNYDSFYSSYFKKLAEERAAIFGDDYMSDEVMFTALEANVASYGDALTGTETVYAADEKTVLQQASTGFYQTIYGEDYKLQTSVKEIADIENLDEYKAGLDEAILSSYGVSVDDITAAKAVTVEVALGDIVIASVTVNEVRIGNTWYVDNMQTDMSAVYALQASVPAEAA